MGVSAKDILSGDIQAAARLMRDLDDEIPSAHRTLKTLYRHTGRAYLLGITGAPGSGKSTLVDCLTGHLRQEGKTVGIVAIDPTSPFSGGAILGDRIRMQKHTLDDGVFIRSLATRGHLGGLSKSTLDIVNVMDAMGKDVVIIETVGVGQDEVEIVKVVHTNLVLVVPGLGDDIQALKAGILEIADIFVVNKYDREGADRTKQELETMVSMNTYGEGSGCPPSWPPSPRRARGSTSSWPRSRGTGNSSPARRTLSGIVRKRQRWNSWRSSRKSSSRKRWTTFPEAGFSISFSGTSPGNTLTRIPWRTRWWITSSHST